VVLDAADEIVEHALAQRAGGGHHRVDLQALEHGEEDGEAPRQHRSALGPQSLQAEPVHVPRGHHRLAELLQARERDLRTVPSVEAQQLRDRVDGPGRADGGIPSQLAQSLAHRAELQRGRRLGGAKRLARQHAAGKVQPRLVHAAHVEAV